MPERAARARQFTLAGADAGFIDDPYPTYAALREHDPVHPLGPGSWLLTRYDDVLDLHARLEPPGAVRLTFQYRIVRAADQALLIEGMTQHACVGKSGAPKRLTPALLQFLSGHARDRWPEDSQAPGGGAP